MTYSMQMPHLKRVSTLNVTHLHPWTSELRVKQCLKTLSRRNKNHIVSLVRT